MIATPIHQSARNLRAFTLVELLVATVVLLIILLMLVAMVNSTATIWRTSSAKVEQFRAARTAFESINRHLSQATLNTYFDYDVGKDGKRKYVRQSDLRFISGSAKDLYSQPTAGDKPPKLGAGHVVFFHAPLGFASSDKETLDPNSPGSYLYPEMDSLLNTWGYFIEYSSDYNYRPPFLNVANNGFTAPPERYRYRLMEFMVPADQITIYNHTSLQENSTYYGHEWFNDFLLLAASPPTTTQDTTQFKSQSRPAHLLAENIISLVIYPQLSAKDQAALNSSTGQSTLLAPGYTYDSAQHVDAKNSRVDPRNQLPPVIQVTMVAMDETSAARLETAKKRDNGSADQPPSFLDGLGKKYFLTSDLTNPQSLPSGGPGVAGYASDLKAMQKDLVDQRITYRTFTTSISLRAAKWSQD